ncbi:cysteine peptidase family C39 domain-containing protein [Actinomycetospora cinnamomea]|nr:cysteine peptidase family C39 domain-containing protein [Actinomycetospora cinnamomea]
MFRRRLRPVLQMEAAECGAAALAMVLDHLGAPVALSRLRADCGVSRDGVNALNIVRAARAHGMEAEGRRARVEELAGICRAAGPVIVYWEQNHFLVVERFTRRSVLLADPAVGPRHVSRREFAESYSGIVLTFSRRAGSAGPVRHAPRQATVLPGLLRGTAPAVATVVAAGVLGTVPIIVGALLASLFVDQVVGGRDLLWSGIVLVGAVAVVVLQVGLTLLGQRMLVRLATVVTIRSTAGFLRHLLALPSAFFDARSRGALVSRVSLNGSLATLVTGQLAAGGIGLVSMVVYAAVLLWWNPVLGAAAVGLASLNALVLARTARRRRALNQDLQMATTALDGFTYTGLDLRDDLRATGSEDEYFGRWAGRLARVINTQQRLGTASQPLVIAPAVLAMLNTVAVLALGGALVLADRASIGELVAVQVLAGFFFAPVGQLVAAGGQIQNARAWTQQLLDVLDEAPERAAPVTGDGARPRRTGPTTTRARLRGHVALQDVTFGYSRLEPPLLEDFRLEVAPGRRVALVGPSGAGKSTVADLLTGLVSPWSGQVLLDGVPRQEVDLDLLHASLARVDQSVALFSGSVAENITLFDPSIPAADITRAARDACLAEEIEARLGGFGAAVHEGGRNFSGGQRQRLDIARALAGNPSVLVLDEATSALDATTESRIDAHLRRRACTCVIVAHRLSTIRDADEIVVLDRGRVVQRGVHDDLLAEEGLYRELVGRG